jgi:uncharacterized membrane protein YhaH (DUF805 family)
MPQRKRDEDPRRRCLGPSQTDFAGRPKQNGPLKTQALFVAVKRAPSLCLTMSRCRRAPGQKSTKPSKASSPLASRDSILLSWPIISAIIPAAVMMSTAAVMANPLKDLSVAKKQGRILLFMVAQFLYQFQHQPSVVIRAPNIDANWQLVDFRMSNVR